MANRYWVGGSGTWDASTTTNWSTSSGGAGGASAPTSSDVAIFDTSSSTSNAAYTVTMSGLPNCLDLTMDWPDPTDTNKLTWAGSGTLSIYGTVNLTGTSAGITRTGTFALQHLGTTSGKTWTSNGVTFNGSFLANGTGLGLTFNDSLNLGAKNFSFSPGGTVGASTITVSSGTITCSNFGATNSSTFALGSGTISCTNFTLGNGSLNVFTASGATITCSGTFTVTSGNLNLGSGTTVTCTTFDIGNTSNPKIVTLGTANITCTLWGNNGGIAYQDTSTLTNSYPRMVFSGASSTITMNGTSFQGGGFSYGSVTINGSSTVVYGVNSFTSFTFNGDANKNNLQFNNDQTVSGTISLNGNSTVNRILVKPSTTGAPITLSAGTATCSYADFQDIWGIGAASWNLSSSTGGAGDCGGNVMKALGSSAFTTAVDQHWTNASSGSWSNASNWTSRIPLPQDNVFMDKAFGTSQTVTADMPRLGKTIDWTGATWTTALTFTSSIANIIFGGWIGISGLTYTANAQTMTYMGRGSHTIDTKGVTMDQPVTIQSFGGTYTLGGNWTVGSTRTLTVSNGTFDTSSYVLSTGLFTSGSGNPSFPVTLNFNTGTHLFTGTGTAINISGGAYNIIPQTAYTLKVTNTSGSTVTLQLNGKLNNIWLDRGNGGATTQIQTGNSVVMNDFRDNGGYNAHTIQFQAIQYFVFTTFTVSGVSGKLITINSTTSGRQSYLLCKTGTINCDYLSIRDTLVGGGATWNAGSNSTFTNGGNHFGTGFGWADAANTVKRRYWITGGDGNWASANNWSTTSGGAAAGGVPNGETVYFDSNSGSGTVNVNTFSAYCGDIDCTGFAGKFICTNSSYYLSPSGSVKFVSGMDWSNYMATINKTACLPSGSSKTYDFQGHNAGVSFNGFPKTVTDEGITDTFTLSSDINTPYAVAHSGGNLVANNYNLTMNDFSSTNASYTRSINMGSGTWTVTGSGTIWNVYSSNMTLTCGTSTIKIATTSATAKTFAGGGNTYYNLYVTNVPATTFSDSATFNDIKFDESNISAALTFAAGSTIAFNTVTIAARAGSSAGTHQFTSTSDLYYLKPLKGSFSTDYVSIAKANVLGVGYVGTHSNVNPESKNVFNAAPSTVISGQVTNVGSGVSDAIVRLVRQEDNQVVGTTTTDGSGNYSFYADATKLYHVFVEYTTGGTKYNTKSLWNVTPV